MPLFPTGFNPRTPCGVRLYARYLVSGTKEFQSTHSLRSATCRAFASLSRVRVSIHALLAECDSTLRTYRAGEAGFNPRTPCGVRPYTDIVMLLIIRFQSTHSLRSATLVRKVMYCAMSVSIHALLAECDPIEYTTYQVYRSFNPRTPCGVRLRLTIYIVIQQRKRYFAPTSRRRPSSPSLLF